MKFITLGKKKIAYEVLDEGKDAAFLFIHGWGGNRNSLRNLAMRFRKDYQVVLIDLPGFGKSDLPDPNWGIEGYGNLIIKFLDSLGISRTLYFGHSFGGALGVYIASEFPERIEKLILCSASFRRTEKEAFKDSGLKRSFKRIFWLPRKGYYKIKYPTSEALKFPKLESNFARIVSKNLTSNLSKIDVKTLILWGRQDTVTPVRDAYLAKRKIPDNRLKIFPDYGHNLPLVGDELVAISIEKFI